MPSKMIFINLPVADLVRSKNFYEAIGWKVNQDFIDDDAGGVVIGEILVHRPADRLIEVLGPDQVCDREIDEDHLAGHARSFSSVVQMQTKLPRKSHRCSVVWRHTQSRQCQDSVILITQVEPF
jgi:hypothetical protein